MRISVVADDTIAIGERASNAHRTCVTGYAPLVQASATQQHSEHIVIVGDGQMALVLADVLAYRLGDALSKQRADILGSVAILSPFAQAATELAATRKSPRLAHFTLSENVRVTADPSVLATATMVVCAIPTQFIRATFTRFADALPRGVPVVSVAKGIEVETFRVPCDIIGETLGDTHALAALSGPTIAAELARRLPAALVAASSDEALAMRVQAAFTSPWTKIYTSDDVVGVELAGACKNVIAIAAGVADGLGLGANAKSALLARGLAEMARVGVALGGRVETFFGVAGAGDLATTCFAPEGRNRSFGERLARATEGDASARVQTALAASNSVVEGVPTAQALVRLARERNLDLPICFAVAAMVFDGLDPRQALAQLMARASTTERIS